MDYLVRYTRGRRQDESHRLVKMITVRRDPRLDWVPLDTVNRAIGDLYRHR